LKGVSAGKKYASNRVSFSASKKENWLRQAWKLIEVPVLTLLILSSFTLGFIGYQKYSIISGKQFNVFTSIYVSLELFKFSGGVLSGPIPLELEIARWLSPFLATYTLVIGFTAIFKNQLRLLGVFLFKHHVVICGLGEKGLLLSRNFHQMGIKVVVIELDPLNRHIAACREDGAVVIIGDAREPAILRKANIRTANYLLCVTGNDALNSDIAMSVSKNSDHRSNEKLNCTIHIEDPNLWSFLRLQEFTAKQSDEFRLDFFNIFDQGAKQLLQEFPLDSESHLNSTPHLLFIGYNAFSEQLILNSAREWTDRFSDTGEKIEISVVDSDAEDHIGRITKEYSLVDRVCSFTSFSYNPNSKDFASLSFLDTYTKPGLSRVYISLDNEAIGLSSALLVLKHLQNENVEIIVSMIKDDGLAGLIHENTLESSRFKHLHLFNLMESTCTPGLVFNSSHESIARAIHTEYLRMMSDGSNEFKPTPGLLPWDKLDVDLKEMNRDQADSIGLKLNTINCDIVPWTDFDAQKFSFNIEEIEKMARLEHERWIRLKIQQGWKYNKIRDDLKKEHPSLLSWDAPEFLESEKEKDRSTVRQIPQLLALAGYQVIRLDEK
jgi:hypothetical protein